MSIAVVGVRDHMTGDTWKKLEIWLNALWVTARRVVLNWAANNWMLPLNEMSNDLWLINALIYDNLLPVLNLWILLSYLHLLKLNLIWLWQGNIWDFVLFLCGLSLAYHDMMFSHLHINFLNLIGSCDIFLRVLAAWMRAVTLHLSDASGLVLDDNILLGRFKRQLFIIIDGNAAKHLTACTCTLGHFDQNLYSL